MSLFESLRQARVLRTLDDAFAQNLRRLRADTDEAVLAAAALASLAVAEGHAAFDITRAREACEPPLDWPDTEALREALRTSAWVAMPETMDVVARRDAPLVLEGDLLYLRRYREYERRLAVGLLRVAQGQAIDVRGDGQDALFAALFAGADAGDLQAQAARMALQHALLLVTGGPGTGKTTTVARILALLLAEGHPLRIALAAPTGRAAARLGEAISRAVQRDVEQGRLDPALAAKVPRDTGTLHRLLGVMPASIDFRHHADNPLACDVVVVDEASMVDLPLMCKLVEAVASGTRLILLGDADQLPSVEAGDVLASILQSPRLPQVRLQRGYRQSERLELAPLAAATREGDADEVLRLLRSGLAGVHFHPDAFDPLRTPVGERLLAQWRELAQETDPAAALVKAEQLRLLCALREGAQGATGLNQRIEALLAGTRRHGASAHFHGRVVLVTENDHPNRLYNGDVGVCLRDAGGRLLAWFPGVAGGVPRAFAPAALPAHESAFAMTVHKAQGSEYDAVWLQLPRQPNRVLSRELLYTAMTRARGELHVAASEAILRAALARRTRRDSGLAARLA